MSPSLSKMYGEMAEKRRPFLERARDASKLTIPTLLPPEGHTNESEFLTPYQSIGSDGVNNLASAMLISLLPPQTPFFRFTIDKGEWMARRTAQIVEAAAQESGLDPALVDPAQFLQVAQQEWDVNFASTDQELRMMENQVLREMETMTIRPPVDEALRHLFVAGNVLIHMPDTGGLRVFRLDRYVVERDPMGKLYRIITCETVKVDQLPEEIRTEAIDQPDDQSVKRNEVNLYTQTVLEDGSFKVHQEVGRGVLVPGSEGTVKEEDLPWMALRFRRIDGESYGRGLIEESQGDLESLEWLSMSIVKASVASAKVLFMVKPTGRTRAKTIARSQFGAVVEGDMDDVGTLQVNKAADMQVAFATAQAIEGRLGRKFLKPENFIRDAERVTAEEIRRLAQAQEQNLGGFYSTLSEDFQLPLVRMLVRRMQKDGRLATMEEKLVSPTIVTGFAGLGRSIEMDAFDRVVGRINQMFGPEVAQMYLKPREAIDFIAAQEGIQVDAFLKSQEEVDQAQQAAQQAQAVEKLGPQVIKGATEMSKLSAQQQAEQQQQQEIA